MPSKNLTPKSEIFTENCNLRMEIEDLRKERSERYTLTDKPEDDKSTWYSVFRNKNFKKFGFIFLLLLMVFSSIFVVTIYSERLISKLVESIHEKQLKIHLTEATGTSGSRKDKDIQDCYDGELKKTFPDVGYALFGYNIIRGYPLAEGRDPGFTRPIFKADYREKRQTPDCRYAVPQGLILAPDVSCVTSFTSKVIKDSKQFSDALSVSAHASGGGWGVSFSASTDYQKKTSQMSASESVFILSTAHCNYYFSKLDQVRPPPLSKSFVAKARLLKNETDIIDFFDYYGTHFPKYVLFGARFTYEHKMSKSNFQKESSNSISVSAQASYSGLLSLSGGFGMSKSQSEKAQNFQQQVETSTISVGAPPPANGDTMTWASTVKDTPVPVKYKLASIEELFTETYMKDTKIDYVTLYGKVKKAKNNYCKYLQRKGKVDSCDQVDGYKAYEKISLGAGYYKRTEDTLDMCKTACLDETKCVAVVYKPGKPKAKPGEPRSCYLYQGGLSSQAKAETDKTKTFLFTDNLKLLDKNFTISDAEFPSKGARNDGHIAQNETMCAASCKAEKDIYLAYTFKNGKSSSEKNCFIYREFHMTTLKYKKGSNTVINPK